ncbi:MAG: DNA polymerase I [Deltaproteobacteria bacterium]|nr:DNA polymerase I [Deltaproteobacteria bacterium]
MDRLYLIDASGYIFRAYYAIRPLSTSKGLPTNALYGFTSMLLKLIREEKPDHIACVFDVSRKTWRNDKFPDYKANRAEAPADLIPQFPYFRKIARALNLPVLELENFEADDVIGTIAKKMEDKNLETIIVTGDKDMMQLVNQKITIFDSMKEKRIGIPEVRERFGVDPERVPDVLALAGDSSDNIPGVSGIGEKTAIKLLQEYGTLENLLKQSEKVPGKLGEKLRQYEKEALLFRELATIVTDAPIHFDFKNFKLQEPDGPALKELFTELEFHRLLSELAPEKTLSTKSYHLVIIDSEIEKLAKGLKNSGGFALDTETSDLDPMKASLVGLSFSYKRGEAYYIPVGHTQATHQLEWERVKKVLKPILEDPKIPKYAQNAKYDYEILRQHGVELQGLQADTMLAAYLLTPDGNHNLDLLSQTYLGHKITTFKEVVGTGKKQKSFAETDLSTACEYSCEDSDVCYRLVEILLPKLEEEKLEALFHEIEMPLLKVLAGMEMNGVKVDVDFLKKISKDYEKRMQGLEEQIHKKAGMDFNLNSTKQLQEVLFQKLKLPVVRKTKTGFSTDVDVLEELAKQHEVPRLLLEYRGMNKLKSTYLDALPELVNPETGRIHTSFNQAVAATGRLSSSDPNLQNIPIRTEEGRRIREAFIAEKGFQLLSADYSQIELRILAHLSQDPLLLQAFEKEDDVHRRTAAEIFGIPEKEVTDEMRNVGKTVNFAVLYGQSAYGLSQQLGIELAEAHNYIDNYFIKYQAVAAFKEKALAQARRDKKVRTLFGRLRHCPEIDSPNQNIRAMAERTAFNTIFQGTAADIIKKAMIEIQKKIENDFPNVKMILQVHDELVFEVPDKEIKRFSELVKKVMEGVVQLSVPLKVDVGVGANWAEAH